jgi:hypothetical protein
VYRREQSESPNLEPTDWLQGTASLNWQFCYLKDWPSTLTDPTRRDQQKQQRLIYTRTHQGTSLESVIPVFPVVGRLSDGMECPHIKRCFLTQKSYCDNDLNKTSLTESDTVEDWAWCQIVSHPSAVTKLYIPHCRHNLYGARFSTLQEPDVWPWRWGRGQMFVFRVTIPLHSA